MTGGISRFNKGDGLTIFSAVSYAAHLLATDKYVKADADPVLLAFHQFWMTGFLSFAIAGIMGYSFQVQTPKATGVIVFLALFPTLSAFYIQMLAQKYTAPIKVSLIFSLEPVFAALFAWTLGGEPFVPARAVGGLAIVAAMMVGELSRLSLFNARNKEVLPV